MKKLLVLALVLLGTICLGAKVVTYDKIKIENIQLFKGAVEIYTLDEEGEVTFDEEGEPIMESVMKWKVGINYTLTGDERRGMTKIFTLTDEQITKVKNFIKGYISELKTETDITDVEE